MKVFLASVAVALAGGDMGNDLPKQLPSSVAGFEFGHSMAALKARCEKLGSKFSTTEDGGMAECANVSTGTRYLPGRVDLTFGLKDDRMGVVGAQLPMDRILAYARAMTRQVGDDAKVHDTRYCAAFADAICSMCVDLKAKVFLLSVGY